MYVNIKLTGKSVAECLEVVEHADIVACQMSVGSLSFRNTW